MVEEEYEARISMPVQELIDSWEFQLVNEHLATDRGGRKINHYWLIKNMMDTLMEDRLGNWSSAHSIILSSKAKLIDLDDQLNGLDAKSREESTRNGWSNSSTSSLKHFFKNSCFFSTTYSIKH